MGSRRRRKMQAGRRSASNFVQGQLGKGRKGRSVPTRKRKSGGASLLLWARGRLNANRRIT